MLRRRPTPPRLSASSGEPGMMYGTGVIFVTLNCHGAPPNRKPAFFFVGVAVNCTETAPPSPVQRQLGGWTLPLHAILPPLVSEQLAPFDVLIFVTFQPADGAH